MTYDLIRLLRPLQWFKNVFVLAPLFFSNNLLNVELLIPTLYAFAAFCLVSSSIYCFNDIYDVEADRQHPRKCKRPIASGAVSVKTGYVAMVCCLLLAVTIGVLGRIGMVCLIGLIGYWLMNVAYCMKLKVVSSPEQAQA